MISKRSGALLPLRSVTSALVADVDRLTSVGVTVKYGGRGGQRRNEQRRECAGKQSKSS